MQDVVIVHCPGPPGQWDSLRSHNLFGWQDLLGSQQAELPAIDVADTLLDERRELTEWAAAHAGTFHSSRDE